MTSSIWVLKLRQAQMSTNVRRAKVGSQLPKTAEARPRLRCLSVTPLASNLVSLRDVAAPSRVGSGSRENRRVLLRNPAGKSHLKAAQVPT